jgi:hypothetical protein
MKDLKFSFSALKETVCLSEISGFSYESTRRQNTEERRQHDNDVMGSLTNWMNLLLTSTKLVVLRAQCAVWTDCERVVCFNSSMSFFALTALSSSWSSSAAITEHRPQLAGFSCCATQQAWLKSQTVITLRCGALSRPRSQCCPLRYRR